MGAPLLRPAATQAPALACEGPCKLVVDASARSGWEPHVALDPRDPDHVVVATRTLGFDKLPASFRLWFDIHDSRDGGRTWNVTPLRYTESLGTATDPTAPNVVGDPVLAFLPDGTLLATGATLRYTLLPGGGIISDVRLYVVRSPDGGHRFEEPVTVMRSEGAVAQTGLPAPLPSEAAALLKMPDKPWLATGPDGTALLTFTGIVALHPDDPTGSRSDILFSVSRDGGRSWSAPAYVARGDDLQGSASAVGADGAWYVAYVDLAARTAHVAVSRDQGATWRDRAAAPAVWMPSLALAGTGGRERILLATPAGGPGEVDAIPQTPTLSWSDDGGATWTPPLALDAPEAPGRVLPSVAADRDGTAYVTFAHATEQGPQFRAVALRPGQWRADLVLDPAIAAPPSLLGDYLGLAGGPAGAFAVWTTTADGHAFDTAGASLRATG